MAEHVIEVDGLHKSFGKVQALRGLDLHVERGRVHGFIGPNGAGKSTTIRVLLGLAVLVWYALTDEVPAEFTNMTPYVATLLVLALSAQRLRMPAADGLVYRKGEAH